MHTSVPARLLLVLKSAVLLVGCGGSETATTSSDSGAGTSSTTTASAAAPDSDGADSADAAQADGWQTVELTDATGETFTVADLVGRPVFVENFATWCGNCRRQLGDTQRAAPTAGSDAVFIALSVETELDADDMAEYAADNEFANIRFAVISPEMLAAMEDAFGNSSLNPHSTPHVVVAADGSAGEMVTGFESPEDILASLGLG